MNNNNTEKYLHELLELENILDSLIFEDEVIPNIFDDETNALELIESALYLMEDYMNENPTAISEPDFEEEFLDIIEVYDETGELIATYDSAEYAKLKASK